MIENAGIAYLSKSEPDLGKLYFDADPLSRDRFKGRTTSAKILPTTDPLTAKLSESFRLSSELFHSNFVSLVGRMEISLKPSDERLSFTNVMRFHDVDPDKPELFLRHATWLLRSCQRVLRVFGAAFALPDCIWYRRLEELERGINTTFARLAPAIEPPKRKHGRASRSGEEEG
jgi:hypothetical protein